MMACCKHYELELEFFRNALVLFDTELLFLLSYLAF